MAELVGYQPWSPTDHLLAGLCDRVAQTNYILSKVNGGKPSQPKPIPRPGESGPKRVHGMESFDVMDPDELRAELHRRYKPREEVD